MGKAHRSVEAHEQDGYVEEIGDKMGGRGGSSGLDYQGKNGGSGRASSSGVNVSDMKSKIDGLPQKVVENKLATEAIHRLTLSRAEMQM